ncbi:MAG: alpha/beta hydrolase [Victivallales bacterium]|jgi:arylformamidase|nr:alpha/beta hydrolase [Victivallales bacterium]
MKIYRGMTREELDVGYDNSSAVINSPEILSDFERRSGEISRNFSKTLNLRYGPKERQKIDYFTVQKGSPLFVFIHGGYWQMRCKETFRFLAAGPLARNYNVAMPGYTLAPEATLTEIVNELRASLRYLREHASELNFDPEQVIVSGWSAGGHLATMMLDEPGVVSSIAISGIFDLEPISLSFLNRKLNLSAQEIELLSPQRIPMSGKPHYAVCGSAELPELQRQTWDYARRRAANSLPGGALTLLGHNHFTILEELANPAGIINRL